uniref:Uncharacterized protein n=1 Tax=Oryza meridionalis TaxID=40149 RepID=A0A0E0ER95_9ORYZ
MSVPVGIFSGQWASLPAQLAQLTDFHPSRVSPAQPGPTSVEIHPQPTLSAFPSSSGRRRRRGGGDPTASFLAGGLPWLLSSHHLPRELSRQNAIGCNCGSSRPDVHPEATRKLKNKQQISMALSNGGSTESLVATSETLDNMKWKYARSVGGGN